MTGMKRSGSNPGVSGHETLAIPRLMIHLVLAAVFGTFVPGSPPPDAQQLMGGAGCIEKGSGISNHTPSARLTALDTVPYTHLFYRLYHREVEPSLDPSVTASLNVLTWARWVAEGYGVENECIMGSPRDGGTPPAF
ncbi:hypothetical protein BDP55DRAFT_630751 [Colletotrichum godetiae]|uniref:Uncharacterized protein n=1 Tax=Colletotrichum godetiae TaxID=1209918 RepID=A0AAJ0ANP4_9PEZI|nr:uncharacterized protein BDP55DRAFT_630751 [Colletotrichum godetiae]KAK1687558.1 hypothetical protein BDP55DRAFT_630751 [Colletotrichum godetiae]